VVPARQAETERNRALDATLDRIRERFGGVAVVRGSGLTRGPRE